MISNNKNDLNKIIKNNEELAIDILKKTKEILDYLKKNKVLLNE